MRPRHSTCWCGLPSRPDRACCSSEHGALARSMRPRKRRLCWCGALALPKRAVCCDEHWRTAKRERACRVCGGPPDGVAAHYCAACRPKRARVRKCVNCGREFSGKKRSTCSDECALAVAPKPHPGKGAKRRANKRASGYKGKDKGALVRARSTAQGGVCAVCGACDTLALDHDHETGEPRSMLCTRCNVAIGQAGESPRILRALARYAEYWHRRSRC